MNIYLILKIPKKSNKGQLLITPCKKGRNWKTASVISVILKETFNIQRVSVKVFDIQNVN